MKLIREWNIGDSVWRVKFSRSLGKHHGNQVQGLCCPQDKMIYILCGLTVRDRWMTLVHELMHAIEFETEERGSEAQVKIPHEQIHRLEEPVIDLIEKNFLGRKLRQS